MNSPDWQLDFKRAQAVTQLVINSRGQVEIQIHGPTPERRFPLAYRRRCTYRSPLLLRGMHTSLSHSLCKIAAFTLHLVCIALLLLTGARGQIGGLDPGLAVGAILNNSLPGEIRALTVRP